MVVIAVIRCVRMSLTWNNVLSHSESFGPGIYSLLYLSNRAARITMEISSDERKDGHEFPIRPDSSLTA